MDLAKWQVPASERRLLAAAIGSSVVVASGALSLCLVVVLIFRDFAEADSVSGPQEGPLDAALYVVFFGGLAAALIATAFFSGGLMWMPVGVAASALMVFVVAEHPGPFHTFHSDAAAFLLGAAASLRTDRVAIWLARLPVLAVLCLLALARSFDLLLLTPVLFAAALPALAFMDTLAERVLPPSAPAT